MLAVDVSLGAGSQGRQNKGVLALIVRYMNDESAEFRTDAHELDAAPIVNTISKST